MQAVEDGFGDGQSPVAEEAELIGGGDALAVFDAFEEAALFVGGDGFGFFAEMEEGFAEGGEEPEAVDAGGVGDLALADFGGFGGEFDGAFGFAFGGGGLSGGGEHSADGPGHGGGVDAGPVSAGGLEGAEVEVAAALGVLEFAGFF